MNTLSYFQQAQKHFLQDHFPESIQAFSASLSQGVEPFRAHLSRGAAYLKTGVLDKAWTDFNAAVELEPGSERALFFRGICALNLGSYEQAVDDLSAAIKHNPERGSSFLARGLALVELQRMEGWQ